MRPVRHEACPPQRSSGRSENAAHQHVTASLPRQESPPPDLAGPQRRSRPDSFRPHDRPLPRSVPQAARRGSILSRPEHRPARLPEACGPCHENFPCRLSRHEKNFPLPERKGNIPEKEARRRRITEHGNKKYFYQQVISALLFIGTPWGAISLSSRATRTGIAFLRFMSKRLPDLASGALTAPLSFPVQENAKQFET